MLGQIALKELRELWRSPVVVVALALLAAMLLALCLGQFVKAMRLQDLHESAVKASRQDWLNQGNHDPHSAAHHGVDVYKPFPPLGVFDEGIFAAQGTTLKVEAHHQHRLENRPSEGATQLLQPMIDSPAIALETVFPLVAIMLGFASISRERERGTLALLLSQGVVWRRLLFGKALALATIIAGLALPAAATLLAAALFMGDWSRDALVRAGLIGLSFVLYGGLWSLVIVWISAHSRNSGVSFLTLIALWIGWVLVIPPAALDFAQFRFPLPTAEALKAQHDNVVRYGDDGKNAFRRIYRELEEQLKKEHGVDDVADLPINFEGASMLAAEKFTDDLIDRFEADLAEIQRSQMSMFQSCSFVSPYIAIRLASMSLAGTDDLHHAEFSAAAEHYRRSLVRTLNEALTVKRNGDTAAPDRRLLWESIPPFEWSPPPWSAAVRHTRQPLLSLLCWFLVCTIGLWATPVRYETLGTAH